MTSDIRSNKWLKFLKSESWNQRYTLCIMGVIGSTTMSANRNCLNQAIEVMTFSHNNKSAEFHWTSVEQGWAKASYFMGLIPSSIPGGLLADRYGGKSVFGFGCTCSGLAAILTPTVTRHAGLAGMIVLRILAGVGDGVTFPAGSNLVSKWVPPQERGRLGGFILTAPQLGVIIGSIGSAYLLTQFPWPVGFYVWGSICLSFSVIFYFICYSEPRFHPFISQRELRFLYENVTGATEVKRSVPYRHILSSVRVWAIILCQFGFFWGLFMLVMDLPKFMHRVMKFGIRERGTMVAIPFTAMYISSMSSCCLADFLLRRKLVKRLTIRKLFAFIATVPSAFAVVGATFCGPNIPILTIALFSIALAFMAFFYCGVMINSLDLSPRNSGLVTALANTVGAFAALLSPVTTGIITSNKEQSDWLIVGIVCFGFMVGGVILFLLHASVDRQWWDAQTAVDDYNKQKELEREDKERRKRRKKTEAVGETTEERGENREVVEEETEEDRKLKGILKKDDNDSRKTAEEPEEIIKGILKKESESESKEPKVEEDEVKRVTIQEPSEEVDVEGQRETRVTLQEPGEEEEEESEEQKEERKRQREERGT